MYDQYFNNREVRGEFKKEYVSLWSGWLGEKELYRLDHVTEMESERFNELLLLIAQVFVVKRVVCSEEQLIAVDDMALELSTYEESMSKTSSMFSKFLIPELECVITEEWDYTYILWYKDEAAIKKLSPLIKEANLHHFPDSQAI